MDEERRNALPSGTEIEGYRIETILGAGGFGVTYKAIEILLGRAVAIKEFLPSGIAVRDGDGLTIMPIGRTESGEYDWGLERFRQEAQTLVGFRHPHIVGVHRYFETNGTGYLVMEYVEGQTLARLISPDHTLEEQEVHDILDPILDGLQAVHDQGFLHRDIKPANILIEADGTPVLIDFGAARQALGQHSKSLTAIISEGYAPYEQYDSAGEQGPWTDIYALGSVLYRCVTGRRPPDAPSRISAMVRGRDDPMEPVASAAKGDYSGRLLTAIDQAVAVREDDRPQTLAEFRALMADPDASGRPEATGAAADPASPAEPARVGTPAAPAAPADETLFAGPDATPRADERPGGAPPDTPAPPKPAEAARPALSRTTLDETPAAPAPEAAAGTDAAGAGDAAGDAPDAPAGKKRAGISGRRALVLAGVGGVALLGVGAVFAIPGVTGPTCEDIVPEIKTLVDARSYAKAKAQIDLARKEQCSGPPLNRARVAYHVALADRAVYLRRNLPEAIRQATLAIVIDPTNYDALVLRGYAYRLQKKYDEAIEDYSRAIRLKPHVARAYHFRTYPYIFKKQWKKALADADKAVELGPTEAAHYSIRAYVHSELGDRAKAFADLKKAIELDENAYVAHNNIARHYERRGQYKTAIDHYDRALKANPRYFLALYNRGDLYRRLGKRKEAIRDLKAALALRPDDKDTKDLLRRLGVRN